MADLNIYVPIQHFNKAKKVNSSSGSKGSYYIGGYASTGSLDYQGERVDPVGIDLSYFKQFGWIDYEHDTEKTIGQPVADKCYVDDNGFYVEAELFKSNSIVRNIMKLAKEIRQSGSHRHLGFSIEGQVQRRDPLDKSIISSILITGVAVTKNPANTDASWSTIQKSLVSHNLNAKHGLSDTDDKALTTGYSLGAKYQTDGAALRPQDLAHRIHNLSYCIGNLDESSKKRLFINTLKCLDKNFNDPYGRQLAIQIMSGVSSYGAKKALLKAHKSMIKESEE